MNYLLRFLRRSVDISIRIRLPILWGGLQTFKYNFFRYHNMEQILFHVTNVSSSYGKFSVSDVSFHLQGGDILGLIGRSGAGKSTLIKTLIGLVKLFNGQVFIRDKEVSRMLPHEIIREGVPLGYVPQLANIFPSLTIEENLKMGLYTKNWSQHYEERLAKMVELFPILEERIKQKAIGTIPKKFLLATICLLIRLLYSMLSM